MGSEFADALAERVHDLVARSEATGARSLVLVDASRYARLEETYVPRCAWCGKVALGGFWLDRSQVPRFVLNALENRTTDGICPACFAEQLPTAVKEIRVHAGNKKTADRLAEELDEFEVSQHPDHVLEVRVPPHDEHFVAQLLSRLADCLEAGRLEPVQVRIGKRSYTLAGR